MQAKWQQPAGVMTLDGNFDLQELKQRQSNVTATSQSVRAQRFVHHDCCMMVSACCLLGVRMAAVILTRL